MAKKRKDQDPHDKADEALDLDVHEALKSPGWVVPECEADVRQAEAEVSAGALDLPEALRDAEAVFEGRGADDLSALTPASFAADPEAEENLARAARSGGAIPPEIEERIRRDREAAEQAMNQEENGEDIG